VTATVCGATSRHQSTAAAGEAMTTTRSPGAISVSPRTSTVFPSRIRPAMRDSPGSRAERSFWLTSWAPAAAGTSSSSTWMRPSANVSVWRAAGIPTASETARAVSS
jgi:hypothetical protein